MSVGRYTKERQAKRTFLSLDQPSASWDQRALGDTAASHTDTPEALLEAAESGVVLVDALKKVFARTAFKPGPRMINVAGLAKRWCCDRKTIYGAIKRGQIPHVRIGRLFLVPLDVVARIERNGQVRRTRPNEDG